MTPLAPSHCELEHSKPAPGWPFSLPTHTQVCESPRKGRGGTPRPAEPESWELEMGPHRRKAWGEVGGVLEGEKQEGERH